MSNQEPPSPPAELSPLERRPTFLLHQLNAELARVCNPVFRQLGVDLITSRILVLIMQQQRIYVGDIVEVMALPQSTVSHQIKRLEKADLITRQVGKSDNRSIQVRLTAKGRRLAEQCDAISRGVLETLFADVPEAELADFVGHLERMSVKLKNMSASRLRKAAG